MENNEHRTVIRWRKSDEVDTEGSYLIANDDDESLHERFKVANRRDFDRGITCLFVLDLHGNRLSPVTDWVGNWRFFGPIPPVQFTNES